MFRPIFFYKKEFDSCARLLTSSEIDVYFLCSGISMYLPGRAWLIFHPICRFARTQPDTENTERCTHLS